MAASAYPQQVPRLDLLLSLDHLDGLQLHFALTFVKQDPKCFLVPGQAHHVVRGVLEPALVVENKNGESRGFTKYWPSCSPWRRYSITSDGDRPRRFVPTRSPGPGVPAVARLSAALIAPRTPAAAPKRGDAASGRPSRGTSTTTHDTHDFDPRLLPSLSPAGQDAGF